MEPRLLWYGLFAALALSYFAVQLVTKDRKYFVYFLSGAALGFYFDLTFTSANCAYPDFYLFKVFVLPLSMIVAEGFAVAITMYLFFTIRRFAKRYVFEK